MNLAAESKRLDDVMMDVYNGWKTQLAEIEASIKELSNILASTEKTDLSENATYTITRDERDMKLASKTILLEKLQASIDNMSYVPGGYIKLGSTFLIETVSVDGSNTSQLLQPFKLVPDALSSGIEGLLSIESQVGSAINGLHEGSIFQVTAPVGTIIYKVREVY